MKRTYMKGGLIFLLSTFLMMVAWVRINYVAYPLPPEKYDVISKSVELKFKVTNTDQNKVELALNEGNVNNNYFLVFELFDGWETGNLGLVLKDMSDRTLLKGNSGKKPDISRFEKDKNGQKVNFYAFEQVLVKDEKGNNYLRMRYVGSPMLLIQSLKIEGPVKVPKHISARFGNIANIEFQPGTYGLDSGINGFWIPVRIS